MKVLSKTKIDILWEFYEEHDPAQKEPFEEIVAQEAQKDTLRQILEVLEYYACELCDFDYHLSKKDVKELRAGLK